MMYGLMLQLQLLLLVVVTVTRGDGQTTGVIGCRRTSSPRR